MPRELTSEHHRVLIMLAGCANGATAYRLTQLNGVASHIIAELVEHELIDARVQYIASRDSNSEAISVVRLTITNAGRRVMAGCRQENAMPTLNQSTHADNGGAQSGRPIVVASTP
jgi:hypothetical protein